MAPSSALPRQATGVDRRRAFVDKLARGACVAATVLAIVPLVAVLIYVAAKGIGSLSLDFLTNTPAPMGEVGGGIKNAIIGTLLLVGIASLIGIPIGVITGIYLAELGRYSKFAQAVRFSADILGGVPSIVIGVFVYTAIVLHWGYSAMAGSVSLAIIMLPTVIRTTEEMLKLVPDALREAALALGVPRWKAISSIVVRTALPGIATGVMLAVARIAGETAPLLFTAFGNDAVSTSLTKPIGSLPQMIFTHSTSADAEWHRQAAAGALVLVILILVLNIGARVFIRRRG
ncbi:MAG: phosphate ABC transporter permease PstA [Deltaproteobacteria bacterium]|nr:phosphate ABC transporter permease PstA [Deltaproteobacteria bacterium]